MREIDVLLSLSKYSLALMILISSYFQVVLFEIPGLITALGFIALLALLWVIYKQSTPLSDGICIETVLWVTFTLTSLYVGYIIAADQSQLINSVLIFGQYLLLIIMICFICKYDGNLDFIVKILTVLAFLCAITTILFGEPFMGSSQISLTAETNPNQLGLILVFGIFCLLYKLNINKKPIIALTALGIIVLLYTIILTGSRKSFLAACFLLIFWLVFTFPYQIKKVTLSSRLIAMTIVILATIYFVFFVTPIFQNSILIERLSQFTQGDENRIGMYREAYEFFMSSPLFGLGYNQYTVHSVYGSYSHSTYAEALACTGLLGAILYISAYITMGLKTVRVIMDNQLDDNTRVQARNILGMLLAMIALGAGIIHFYSIDSSLVFAVIIGFNQLHYESVGGRLPDE